MAKNTVELFPPEKIVTNLEAAKHCKYVEPSLSIANWKSADDAIREANVLENLISKLEENQVHEIELVQEKYRTHIDEITANLDTVEEKIETFCREHMSELSLETAEDGTMRYTKTLPSSTIVIKKRTKESFRFKVTVEGE